MPGLLGYCETKAEEDWHLELERQACEAARDAEEFDQMKMRIAELEVALRNIAHGNWSNIVPDTQSANDALQQVAEMQRIALAALGGD